MKRILLIILLILALSYWAHTVYNFLECQQAGGVTVLGFAKLHCLDPSLLVGGTKL